MGPLYSTHLAASENCKTTSVWNEKEGSLAKVDEYERMLLLGSLIQM